MEVPDLRDMVEDEVAHKETINASLKAELRRSWRQ